MANNSSSTRALEKIEQQALVDLSDYDFIYSVLTHSNLPFITSLRNRNLASLRTKINRFYQEHPIIVNDLKLHFYDAFIAYILKHTFDPAFTPDDVDQTNRLINIFFIKHKQNIKIIFDYFFDEVKPLILNSMLPSCQRLHPYISDMIHKSTARKFTMTYLKKSGASYLTSLMYPNQMELVENHKNKLSKQSSSHKKKSFLLLLFFIMLCIIFGSEIFRFMCYYFLGIIFTVPALYLFTNF